MNEVDEPNSATAHIQNTAPGPPKAMAVATPAILPTPTRPESETIKDWKEDTPSADLSPLTICLSMSGTQRTCRPRVTTVK